MAGVGPSRSAPAYAPSWLTARPIAHRGLHDARSGVIENTVAAAAAAIERGFAIECDIQLTADGEAVVFHDFTLRRLTVRTERIDATAAPALGRVRFKAADASIPSFATLLAHIAGRVPLICELKSRFDGNMRLAERAVAVAAEYEGPLAFKSFDPSVIAYLRDRNGLSTARPLPLGIVAEASYGDPEWAQLDASRKFALANLLHYRETRPDFLSYAVDDLPHAVPYLCRHAVGLPVIAWTVRTPDQHRIAAEHADQIIFEGPVP